tara:strand:+ start:24293 stop:27508 length:3216 start_codon:yes stop_codon:yes gene_type:complete
MAKTVDQHSTIEDFRKKYNELATDVGDVSGLTLADVNVVDSLNTLDNRSFFFQEFAYTATSGQTVFTGSDGNNVLKVRRERLQVFKNGALLQEGDDYILGSDNAQGIVTTVNLTSGASAGDTIVFFAFTGSYLGVAGGTGGGSSFFTETAANTIYNTNVGGIILQGDDAYTTTLETGFDIQLDGKTFVGDNLTLKSAKTLTAPIVNIDGGNIDGTAIGESARSTGKFSDVDLTGNLTVTGNATINGNLTFGDADTDSVAFNADVNSHLIPNIDATYNLGSSSKEWNNAYFDGTVTTDALVADTADINGGNIDGTIIGSSSAAAISGTTINGTTITASTGFSGNLTGNVTGNVSGSAGTVSSIAAHNTGDLSEGSNLYYTSTRAKADADTQIGLANLEDLADTVFSTPVSGHLLSYNGSQWVNSAQGSSDTITEGGTNLFYSDERAQDAVYNALNHSNHTNVTVAYADSANEIRLSAASAENIFQNVESDSGTAAADQVNDTLTITGGSGLQTSVSGDTLTIDHSSTGASSVNNSGATVIQDLTIDAQGHLTGVNSHTMTLANLGYTGATNANNYTFSIKEDGGTAYPITSGSAVDFRGSGSVAVSRSNGIVTFTGTDTNTTNFNIQTNSDTAENISAGETINFIDGTNIDITRSGNSITIANAGSNAAITSDGSTPSLASGITGAEVRSLIGAGTSSTDNNTVTQIREDTGSYRTGNITLQSGSNVTITEPSTGVFNIASTDTNTDTNTVTRVREDTGDYRTGDLTLKSGTNVSIVETATGEFTINSTDTDTNTTNFNINANGGDNENIGAGEAIRFNGGGATSVTRSGNSITISSTDTNTDTNTTYSTATASELGLVKIGYGENGKNYPVELSSGKMYVNVPWTDTDTNTQLSTADVRGKFSAGTNVQISSGGVISATDTNTDTNTTYTGSTGIQLVGTDFRLLGSYTGNWTVTGNVHATADVIAYYSDERLKDFEGKIPNALDKVSQLNGYYFKENETAKDLGFNNDLRQVGVSAQEVEAIMPEIIKSAPINEEHGTDYKTVQYEKMVPLLIEAIKELKEEIEELKGSK